MFAFALVLTLAASPRGAGVLILPPEPAGGQPEAWIAQAVSDALPRGLAALGVPVLSRADRLRAHEALEIPAVPLSRATSIRMAEAVGADRLVTGTYAVEEGQLTLSLRMLDVSRATLSAPLISTGPLAQLAEMLDGLAWDLALAGTAPPAGTREAFLASRPKLPLDAVRLYGLGLVARDPKTRTNLLRRAIVAAPSFEAARLALGELLLAQREFSLAHEALGRIPARSPLYRASRFLQGVALIEIGRYREAASLFAALAEAGASPGVLNNQALAVLRDRRASALLPPPLAASELLLRARDLDRDSVDIAFNRAWALLVEGQAQTAAAELKDLARQAPLDRHVRVVLSWSLRQAGRTDEAEKEWRAVLALAPGFESFTRPDLTRRFERIFPSERPFEQGRETRSDAEVAASLLGKAQRFFDAGDLQGALPEATRAAYLDPYNRRAHLLLARLHRARGEGDEALNEFRMALWAEDEAEVRVEVATLLREMGRLAESRAEAEKALKLAPGHEAARKLAGK